MHNEKHCNHCGSSVFITECDLCEVEIVASSIGTEIPFIHNDIELCDHCVKEFPKLKEYFKTLRFLKSELAKEEKFIYKKVDIIIKEVKQLIKEGRKNIKKR